MVFIKNMKLSEFLFEQNEDPNSLVLILRDYLSGDATKEEVMEVIPEIKEIKGNGALLEFDDYWDLFSEDSSTDGYIDDILNDTGSWIYEDQESEDWDQGYGFYNFSKEDKARLNQVMSLIYPELRQSPCDFEDSSNCTRYISDFISEEFSRQLSNIFYSITEAKNIKILEELKEELFSEYSFPLPKGLLQMMVIEPYESFVVTIPQLLNFIQQNNNDSEDLVDIIKNYNHKVGYYPNWEDGFYEYGGNWDDTDFRKRVNRLLEDMENSIMDGEESFSKYTKVGDFFSLLKDFGVTVGQQKKFPENSVYGRFRIVKFLHEEDKVLVQVTKKPNEFQYVSYKLPIEDVKNLLTTYSLF